MEKPSNGKQRDGRDKPGLTAAPLSINVGPDLAARPHERKGYLFKARSWLRRNRRVAGDGRVGRIARCRRLAVAPVLGVGVGVGAAVARHARLLLVLAVVRVPVAHGV